MRARNDAPVDTRGGGYTTDDGYQFELTGGSLCLDFANTLDSRPTEAPRELLSDYRHLVDWAMQAEALSPAVTRRLLASAASEPARARVVLGRARALRESVFQVFSAHARGARIPQGALDALNRAVSGALARLRLAKDSDGFRWEWKEDQALDRMLWSVARSAGELLTSDRLGQVRVCAAPDCDWLFLDTSRNGSRRWCDMRVCGNRSKVRRYRAARR